MHREMEEYVKNVIFHHRQEVRQKLLNEVQKRQKIVSRRRELRFIYVLVTLIFIFTIMTGGLVGWKYQLEYRANGSIQTDEYGSTPMCNESVFEITPTSPDNMIICLLFGMIKTHDQ